MNHSPFIGQFEESKIVQAASGALGLKTRKLSPCTHHSKKYVSDLYCIIVEQFFQFLIEFRLLNGCSVVYDEGTRSRLLCTCLSMESSYPAPLQPQRRGEDLASELSALIDIQNFWNAM